MLQGVKRSDEGTIGRRRQTAKRKSALVIEIVQDKTTVAEAVAAMIFPIRDRGVGR